MTSKCQWSVVRCELCKLSFVEPIKASFLSFAICLSTYEDKETIEILL